MKISVILPTYRKNCQEELDNLNHISCHSKAGNTDLPMEFRNLVVDSLHDVEHILSPTLDCLCNQNFEVEDFEVLLCHKYPKDCFELVNAIGHHIQIKLIEEKHSIWHKLGDYATVNNNRNTGIIHAKGELLFFLDDMTIFNENLLQEVWDNYQSGFYTTCPSIKRIKIESDKIVGSHKLKEFNQGDIINNLATWSYGMSVSLKETLLINGFDEIYDGSFGGTDMDFGRRLSKITSFKRMAGPMIYEFSHYSEQKKRPKIRDDEVFRRICGQAPNPRYIKANSWKPSKDEMDNYECLHSGVLDTNWNKFMEVPLYDIGDKRNEQI